MNESQREFMLLLASVFLRFDKSSKALIILNSLDKLFPQDIEVSKELSYASLREGNYENALKKANLILTLATKGKELSFGNYLKSKSLWRMDRKDEARSAFFEFVKNQTKSSE